MAAHETSSIVRKAATKISCGKRLCRAIHEDARPCWPCRIVSNRAQRCQFPLTREKIIDAALRSPSLPRRGVPEELRTRVARMRLSDHAGAVRVTEHGLKKTYAPDSCAASTCAAAEHPGKKKSSVHSVGCDSLIISFDREPSTLRR